MTDQKAVDKESSKQPKQDDEKVKETEVIGWCQDE